MRLQQCEFVQLQLRIPLSAEIRCLPETAASLVSGLQESKLNLLLHPVPTSQQKPDVFG